MMVEHDDSGLPPIAGGLGFNGPSMAAAHGAAKSDSRCTTASGGGPVPPPLDLIRVRPTDGGDDSPRGFATVGVACSTNGLTAQTEKRSASLAATTVGQASFTP